MREKKGIIYGGWMRENVRCNSREIVEREGGEGGEERERGVKQTKNNNSLLGG